MTTTLAVLNGGLNTLSRASHHTTHALARNLDGDRVPPASPYAVRWDANGALLKAAGEDRFLDGSHASEALHLITLAAGERGHVSPTRCNDVEGFAGAVSMLKRALAIHGE